jgi:hypothetical protein
MTSEKLPVPEAVRTRDFDNHDHDHANVYEWDKRSGEAHGKCANIDVTVMHMAQPQ